MFTPKFFDIHTHTHFVAFDKDRDIVILRARDAGVAMINVGTQKDTSRAAVLLADKYPGLAYAAVGLHPVHTDASYHDMQELGGSGEAFTSRGEVFDADFYRELAQHKNVVAIGECGLDYFRVKNPESRIKQEDVFRKQIELAVELDKPIMIHCRNAYREVADILNSYFVSHASTLRGNIHFFAGTWEEAKWFLNMGFTLSFTGVITFARQYDDIIKNIPLDMIMSETDAPYVSPEPYRGARNEPAYVSFVVQKIADIRGEPIEKVSEALVKNAQRVFSL